jgi:outer membrane protein OmpA-like peptidoglycan-associated protein
MMTKAAAFLALALGMAARAGDLEKANQYLQQALQAPDNGSRIQLLRKSLTEQASFAAHYQLGKALRDTGQLNPAIQEFRHAMELTGSSDTLDRAHALFQIGATMAQEGNPTEGLTYMQYSLALEKHPAVEQAILKLQSQLSLTVQPAGQLERAFIAASRDLILDDSSRRDSAAGKIPVWIQFEFDRADLAPEGETQAIQLGQAVSSKAFADCRFRIIGHTDLIGDPEYNLALSRRRAVAVAAYLSSHFHIPQERLLTDGHGMEEPLVTKGSRKEQAVNRRVDVVILAGNQ